MAEITLNRIAELLRSVLELLWNKPGGLPAHEVLAFLPEITPLTDYEKGFPANSRIPRYEHYVRLATLPLTKAGWLVKNDKGRWYITDEGRKACRRYTSAQALYAEALRRFEDSRQGTPAIVTTLEEAQEKAWEQIQKYLQEMTRFDFQQLIADLLIAMGYYVAWMAPPEKERGHVDLVVNVDPLGAKGPRILVQVTHKGQPVTAEGLKSFLSVLGTENHGLFVSSGGFTPEAVERVQTD